MKNEINEKDLYFTYYVDTPHLKSTASQRLQKTAPKCYSQIKILGYECIKLNTTW